MEKILIANRGEIAVRIIKTARSLGYRTVAVYSEADAGALHVSVADEAVCIGPAAAGESYLVIDNILAAAAKVAADAVHPGYGFLSENAGFARVCASAGLTFIGPSADAIELMGSKRLSKIAMLEAGVPCVPGYQGADQTDDVFAIEAEKIGYPLMIKASAGGGGRGMRLVETAGELVEHLSAARSEAKNAFGSDELILEKAIVGPRHIEFQIFGDSHGNIIHLFERDCSIQRRHQKVVEEAPSPFMTEELRERMGAAAVNAAKACDYHGAGTVEFLVDHERNFYFLEMNTRLQVEHPVTECVTGVDLVAWQFLVAEGETLPLSQEEVQLEGHAVEVRLYAEDPESGFMPQTGTAHGWHIPDREGVRIDHGLQTGQTISSHYDPMLAKFIGFGPSREIARRRLISALKDSALLGVSHNRQFLQNVISHPVFAAGDATTSFLQAHFSAEPPCVPIRDIGRAAMILLLEGNAVEGETLWGSSAGHGVTFLFDVSGNRHLVQVTQNGCDFSVDVGGERVALHFVSRSPERCTVIEGSIRSSFHYAIENETIFLDGENGHVAISNVTHEPAAAAGGGGDGRIRAPMDGAVIDVRVVEGDMVAAGDALVVMEAMKMEHSLKAASNGTVKSVSVTIGDQVKSKQILAIVVTDGEGEEV